MADIDVRVKKVRRVVQPSTWGEPRRNRTPLFNRLMLGWMIVVSKWFAIVAITEVAGIVLMILVLTFGTTFFHLFASDGSVFSCEVPLVQSSR
jgi:hypothetical protein